MSKRELLSAAEKAEALDEALGLIEQAFGKSRQSPHQVLVEAEVDAQMQKVYAEPMPPGEVEGARVTRDELLRFKQVNEDEGIEVDLRDPAEVARIAALMPRIRWEQRIAERRRQVRLTVRRELRPTLARVLLVQARVTAQRSRPVRRPRDRRTRSRRRARDPARDDDPPHHRRDVVLQVLRAAVVA